MPNTNKARGKYFENKIVEEYRKTLNLSKIECYRAAASGARFTVELNGDVNFSDPITYNIITECKYRKTISLDNLFPIINSEVDEWLVQSDKQKTLYVTNAETQTLPKNKDPICVIISGKPHQKVENYYVILHYYLTLKNFKFKEFAQTYSESTKNNILIVPFYSYLEYLKVLKDKGYFSELPTTLKG